MTVSPALKFFGWMRPQFGLTTIVVWSVTIGVFFLVNMVFVVELESECEPDFGSVFFDYLNNKATDTQSLSMRKISLESNDMYDGRICYEVRCERSRSRTYCYGWPFEAMRHSVKQSDEVKFWFTSTQDRTVESTDDWKIQMAQQPFSPKRNEELTEWSQAGVIFNIIALVPFLLFGFFVCEMKAVAGNSGSIRGG